MPVNCKGTGATGPLILAVQPFNLQAVSGHMSGRKSLRSQHLYVMPARQKPCHLLEAVPALQLLPDNGRDLANILAHDLVSSRWVACIHTACITSSH